MHSAVCVKIATSIQEQSFPGVFQEQSAVHVPQAAESSAVHCGRRLQQDTLTDQHSFMDDLCGLAGDAALAPLLQGGDAGGDTGIFANATALAGQQPQAAALLVRAAQVTRLACGYLRMRTSL